MGADVVLDGFLQQEYKQWEKTHAKMKDSPPPDGHDYLKHANNLLVLLEGVSELHPIAKGEGRFKLLSMVFNGLNDLLSRGREFQSSGDVRAR